MNLSETRKTKVGLESLIMQFYRVESYDSEFMKALTTKEGQASISQLKTLKLFGCEFGAFNIIDILKSNTTLHWLLVENSITAHTGDKLVNFP